MKCSLWLRSIRITIHTVSERESLSTSLLASVESSVSKTLEDIEGQARDLQDGQAIQVSVGPFSVFNSVTHINHNSGAAPNGNGPPEHQNPLPTSAEPSTLEAQQTSLVVNEDQYQHFRSCESNLDQESDSFDFGLLDIEGWQELSPSSLDYLQWTDLFTAGAYHESPCVPPGRSPTADESGWSPLQPFTVNSETMAMDPKPEGGSTFETPGWPILNLDSDIPSLLQHFDDNVVSQMGALPINEKSAWRILNYPSAVVTLAKLTAVSTLQHNITHACLSNFFAVVAVSSLHLSVNPEAAKTLNRPSEHWASMSDQIYEKAKYHLGVSLASESEGPGKAKYKDQLMAMAAILATAVSLRAHPWDYQRISNSAFCSSSPQTHLMLGDTS